VPTRKRAVRKLKPGDVARARREQIVEAAVRVITSSGLHNLSLSKIESWAGMKRGQLTYYFPTKEEILLAVFDRMLGLLCEQLAHGGNRKAATPVPVVWDCVREMLQTVLKPGSDLGREFHALQYTFLAQIAHREDFRLKLAEVFAGWRDGIAAHWADSGKPKGRRTKNEMGETVSAFVQALVHGLAVQLAADPKAFDRTEMLKLCVRVLAPLFDTPAQARGKGRSNE
jgi:AcrR family transcriptional regulator